MNKRAHTDFLFAQPSFSSGAARTLDLWGEFDAYSPSDSEADADAKAIASDWLVVGQDIAAALEQCESELKAA